MESKESQLLIEETKNRQEVFSCNFHMGEVNYPFSATRYDGIRYKTILIGKITEYNKSLYCKAVFYDKIHDLQYEIKNSILSIDGHYFSSLDKIDYEAPRIHWTFYDNDFLSHAVFDDVKEYEVITKSIEFDIFKVDGRIRHILHPPRIIVNRVTDKTFDEQSKCNTVKIDQTSVFISGKYLFVFIRPDFDGSKKGETAQLKLFAKLK